MKKTKKQLFAILALILIGLLIIAFVISAFVGTKEIFLGLLGCIITLPILAWIFIAIYGKMTQKSTIADLFPETEQDRKTREDANAAIESEQSFALNASKDSK